jgi:hypothetical protein
VTNGGTVLPGTTGGASATTGGGTGAGGQGSVNTTSGAAGAGGGLLPSTSLQNLPSTNTAGDSAPLAIFGGFLVAIGAFLLRKPRSHQR